MARKENRDHNIEEISKMNLADLDRPDVNAENQETDGPELPEEQAGRIPGMEKEKMADPVGEHYTLDATITKPELGDFVRNHMMHTPAVWGIMLMGLGLPIYSYFVQPDKFKLSLAFFAVLFIVFPIWQYKKIVDQNLKNPIYENVFHYMVDEDGFHLEAGLRAVDIEWKMFTSKREMKSCYVYYTGKKNAYIFPKKDLGAQEEQFIGFVDRMTGF